MSETIGVAPPEIQAETHATKPEKKQLKRKRVRLKNPLPTLFHRKHEATQTVRPEPREMVFATPRALHHDRGYHRISIGEIIKKRERKTGESREIVQQGENGNGFRAKHPLLCTLEQKSQQAYQRTKPTFHWTAEKFTGGFEHIKWFLGRVSRGDIVKRLQKIEKNPQAYQTELQTELTRAMATVVTAEDMSFVTRHIKDFAEGIATLSTVAPVPIPTPFLPIVPFRMLGSLTVTGINIYNTVEAFRQKRFRKAFAYSAMTGAGLLFGFIPGIHNLFNTWYTELLQQSFDHAESEGMLKIIQGLTQDKTSGTKMQLGQHLISQSLREAHTKTGIMLSDPNQLERVIQARQQEKTKLLEQVALIQDTHNNLPGFFRSFAHPKDIPGNVWKLQKILWQSVNLSQELVDTEDKLQSAQELQAIFTSAQSNTSLSRDS